MLLVAGIYALAMAALIVWDELARRRAASPPQRSPGAGRRRLAAAALVISGALAAVGGAVWLVEHSSTPVPTRLIGDLRVPAAAVLAGAVVLVGPNRSLLCWLFLPVSMLLVTLWRQEILSWQWFYARGYAFQLVELMAMLLTAHGAFRAAFSATSLARRRFLIHCGLKTTIALAVVALQASSRDHQTRYMLHIVGIVIWLYVLGALSLPRLKRAGAMVWARLRGPTHK